MERGERRRTVARWVLGATLVYAGVAHLASAREEFQAQVPAWVPLDEDLVVVLSGLALEIALGAALLLLGGSPGWRSAGSSPGSSSPSSLATSPSTPKGSTPSGSTATAATDPPVLPAAARRVGAVVHRGVAVVGASVALSAE